MHSSLETSQTTAPATLERRESSESMLGDKLILRGLKFYGFHGVLPEEKKLGQMFLVDIDAWLSLKKAGESDNLADTVSYVDIFRGLEPPLPPQRKDVKSMVASGVRTAGSPYWGFPSSASSPPPRGLAKEIVEGPPKNLLEAVAELIASKTLEMFPKIKAVRVRLAKPNPPLIKSTVDYLGGRDF